MTALLVNIFERKQEARNPFFRVVELDRRHRGPGGLGQELPAAVRRLPAHRRPGAHALRRQRGGAAHADRRRPALGRRAVAPRGGPAAEDDVGRLRVLDRLPRGARPRLHARGPDATPSASTLRSSPAPASTATPRSTSRTRRRGGGDLIEGFEALNQMPYAEARKLVTHPVACIDCHDPETMELRVTRPGFLEGIRALKASAGRRRLRRERDGHAPGDALASSAASATSSTTSRAPRSGSPTRGRRA